jgi:diacylglycerol kinase (ATP)
MQAGGNRVEVLHTCSSGHATELAARTVQEAPDLIVAAGGDGTVNEVVNGMALSAIPLAILPFGTTNVLALETGIPRDAAGATAVAIERPARKIALGHVSFGGSSRYFALMSGFGFDALSVYNMNKALKKRTGKLAYIVSGFRTLARWNPVPITLRCDGRELLCSNVLINNGRKYAGEFMLAPDADIADPRLHVIALSGMTRLDILKFTIGILTGKHVAMRGIEHFTVSRAELSGPVHIQLDGEHVGKTPAEVSIVPDALSLVY